MRRNQPLLLVVAALLALALAPSPSEAQCYGGSCAAPAFAAAAPQPSYSYAAPAYRPASPTAYAPAAYAGAGAYAYQASQVQVAGNSYAIAHPGGAWSGGYLASYSSQRYSAYGYGGGDIVARINQLRASRGLGPVSWDGGLAAQATQNSQIGFGHAFMGSARRQNAAVSGSPDQAFQQWMGSPAHLSAMLDPSVTRVGLGQSGGTYTLNLN